MPRGKLFFNQPTVSIRVPTRFRALIDHIVRWLDVSDRPASDANKLAVLTDMEGDDEEA